MPTNPLTIHNWDEWTGQEKAGRLISRLDQGTVATAKSQRVKFTQTCIKTQPRWTLAARSAQFHDQSGLTFKKQTLCTTTGSSDRAHCLPDPEKMDQGNAEYPGFGLQGKRGKLTFLNGTKQ